MIEYILIGYLNIITEGSPSRPAASTFVAEFRDKTACEEAGKMARESFEGEITSVFYICAPKITR